MRQPPCQFPLPSVVGSQAFAKASSPPIPSPLAGEGSRYPIQSAVPIRFNMPADKNFPFFQAMSTPPFAVFLIFLRLGLTSFGGPIAHLGYFRVEFVERRKWLNESAYADVVALCQLLPGPASSQVGIALGMMRSGWAGGLAAWLGFTAPSAIALILFGVFVAASPASLDAGWLHGLKVVAVAVVAQALWGMGKTLCPDASRASLAVLAAGIATALPDAYGQVGVIMAGAVAGYPAVAIRSHGTADFCRGIQPQGRYCGADLVCGAAACPALAGADLPSPSHATIRCFFQGGVHRIRRRPCGAAAAASRSSAIGMGVERPVFGWLRRGTGGARTAVYLCRLSRQRIPPRRRTAGWAA